MIVTIPQLKGETFSTNRGLDADKKAFTLGQQRGQMNSGLQMRLTVRSNYNLKINKMTNLTRISLWKRKKKKTAP